MIEVGSGSDGNLTFLDILSLLSFIIAVENLDMNITQEDMQNSTETLDKDLRRQVNEIHQHLQVQDEKLDMIMEAINGTERNM